VSRKVCKSCKKRRSINSFPQDRGVCRPCYSERRKDIGIERKQKVLDYLREHPCLDCGETDPVVLEFDHVRGIKKSAVADLIRRNYSWSVVAEEIEKCEVRCANCHRLKTARDHNYWIYEQEYR
jgi:L-lysine 2,3-aminomutase